MVIYSPMSGNAVTYQNLNIFFATAATKEPSIEANTTFEPKFGCFGASNLFSRRPDENAQYEVVVRNRALTHQGWGAAPARGG